MWPYGNMGKGEVNFACEEFLNEKGIPETPVMRSSRTTSGNEAGYK